MYRNCFKRILDFLISLTALVVLSPFFLIFIIIGFFVMRGNPFFTQERPGKDEKVFKLIKFRSMSNKKDKDGNLLPDKYRITKYGEFIRAASIDELPELINVLKGDMALVGPRPLLVEYLPYYTEKEKHRHDVRPGLTGLAQISGRNTLSWEDRFEIDLQYVRRISFLEDIEIILRTVKKVIVREGISSATSETMEEFMGADTEQTEKMV